MKHVLFSLAALALTSCAAPVHHTSYASATYLGNEGLMIAQGDTKILMDPLYANGFGVYQMVPGDMHTALMQGAAPYDNIDAIFVSHIHPDHFDVKDVITYMQRHTDTRLFLPQDGLEWMLEEAPAEDPIYTRVTAANLEIGAPPQAFTLGELKIDTVRVPHSGGARHAGIHNVIWRVTLGQGATVMHMGDAPFAASHYTPHAAHFAAKRTDTAFPPYWLLVSPEGRDVIDTHVNAESAIGIHVPINVPPELTASGADHFHTSGETRDITPPVE